MSEISSQPIGAFPIHLKHLKKKSYFSKIFLLCVVPVSQSWDKELYIECMHAVKCNTLKM